MERRKKIIPYLFVLPAFTIILFVFIIPMFQVIKDSFYKFQAGKTVFIGFQNYIYLLFEAPTTRMAFVNNLKLLLTVPVLLFLSLIIAFIFYTGIKGGKVYQTLLFLPKVISIVVVGVVFSYLLRDTGIINHFFKSVKLPFLAQNWLSNYKIAIYTVGAVFVWKELGFGIILFLARLSSLDEYILDAAKVDGASWFQTLFYIIIPQLKGIISFFIIYHVMIVFAWVFTYVYVITGGGPAGTTTVIELEIYKYAFERNLRGVASAFSVLLLLGTFIFIFIQYKLRKEKGGY